MYAGVVPLLGITGAYWLGVNTDVLPSCFPYIDGCTSISATGRRMPGSLIFRAVLLPQVAVLVILWHFAAHWLRSLAPSSKAPWAIVLFGLVGAVALLLYVSFLGTSGAFYEFMRRTGIYFYFFATVGSQLVLAIAYFGYARRTANPELTPLAVAMLGVCILQFVIGIAIVVLKTMLLDDTALLENRIEWNSALLIQVWFVLLWFAWRKTGFTVEVHTH